MRWAETNTRQNSDQGSGRHKTLFTTSEFPERAVLKLATIGRVLFQNTTRECKVLKSTGLTRIDWTVHLFQLVTFWRL